MDIQGWDELDTQLLLDETAIFSVPPSATIVISSLSTAMPPGIPISSSSLHEVISPMQRISPNVILFKYFINWIFLIVYRLISKASQPRMSCVLS